MRPRERRSSSSRSAALAGTITQRFAAQVERASAIALAVSWRPEIAGGAPAQVSRHWTYAELDAHARAVAADILAVTGPGPGRIALLLGHDGPMVAGLLGVLQAGKAYVPLDPYAPRARNEWVLQDAGAEAIVTDELRLAAAPWLPGTGVPLIMVAERGA